MVSEPALLRAQNISFRHGQQAVLAGLDLELKPGQVVGLLGPNGSGKSTTIKLLSGVWKPFEGQIFFDQKPLSQWSRKQLARHLAVVPQEPVFTFPFTALEVVLMGRYPHLQHFYESNEDHRLAHEALAACGVDHLAQRSIANLSSGERQRVVFARALAQQPRCLLLDEPASFLDIRHQTAIYNLVSKLAATQNCAVLAVMHDLNFAAAYCQDIYLLKEGKCHAHGPMADVMTPQNLGDVFGIPIQVHRDPKTGQTSVLANLQRDSL